MNKYLCQGICALIVCASACLVAAEALPPSVWQTSVTPHAVVCSTSECAPPQEKIAAETLPPITEQPLAKLNTADCSKTECIVSQEQLSAMSLANRLYQTDMPKVAKFHFQAVNEGVTIEVTVTPNYVGDIPSYYTIRGNMPVTYIFNSSGTVLRKKYFNR